MTLEKKTNTWTSKDTFNIVSGKSLAEAGGVELIAVAIAIGEDTSNETGESVKTGYLLDAENNMYTTVSKTARQQLEALIDMFNEAPNELIRLKVCLQQCKNNKQREFVYFDML